MRGPIINNFRELLRWPFRRDKENLGESVMDETCFGLRILYPEGEHDTTTQQVIDIVAVHGLGGHAMSTWTHAPTGKLWLRDFLPFAIPNARIMTFGYDSRVMDSRSISGLMDDANLLLTHLCHSRNSEDLKTRPLIFIGHSLGGLIIKKALIMARDADAHRQIHDNTCAIMFMGVPHGGTNVATLANHVIKVAKLFFNLNRTTLKALRRDSRQLHDISSSFGYLTGFDIITVMESEKTLIPGTTKSMLVVPQTSARLNLGDREEWFHITGADHYGVCKFAAEDNAGYMLVREGLRKQVAKLRYPVTTEMLLFVAGGVGSGQLMRHLPAAGQQDLKSRTPPSSPHLARFYWIFKNMDFERWQSTNRLEALWISGPAECRIPDAFSCIVKLGMKASSGVQHLVLYFFCSNAPTNVPIAITFVGTIIHQLVHSLPRLKEEITTVFLRTLLKAILREEPLTNQEGSRFKRDDSVEVTVKKILKASSNGYWDALRAVINIGCKYGLSFIIDGLDQAGHQKYGFIREVCAFIGDLWERPTTTRVLLTSRPQAAIKEILSGLPCIEYDRERKECLNSLRFDNTRYEKISEQHEGSLEWLWEHEIYHAWSSTDISDLLLIEGKPGSGKSTLMKYFQRSLMGREPCERQIVASFYYSSREGEQQTNHSSMLRSVLHDILNQDEEFFFHFQPYYRKAVIAGGQPQWSYDSLKGVLLSFMKNHPVEKRLYLVIDAVDESDDRAQKRYDIIKLLHELCATKGPCIMKVFVASRPVIGLSGLLAGTKMIRLQDVNNSDIVRFVKAFLGKLDLPSDIVRPATEYIVENAQGVFVWVRLVREELIKYGMRGCTKDQLSRFLEGLPKELEEFYSRILVQLERGGAEDVEVGRMMLEFVLFAFRPLKLEELRQALAIPRLGTKFSSSDEPFERKLILGIEQHIICCAGNFLEIKGSHENRIVQAMHQTVPEFFRLSGPTAQTRFSMSDRNGHRRIAITCIRYLMLCSANTSLADQPLDIQLWTSEYLKAQVRYLHERPLIIYALTYLEKHICKCGGDTRISELISQFIEQLASLENPISYIIEDWVHRNRQRLGVVAEGPYNSNYAKKIQEVFLHTAAQGGYPRAVEALLAAGADVEARRNDKTALMVAARSGHTATVQVLLDQGALIEAVDSIEQRALHVAAASGHTAVVGLLIDWGAEMEAEDEKNKRGLHLAARNGRTDVVRLLIGRGADIEANGNAGWRGLHYAAVHGHIGVVKLLMDQGADTEAMDSEGRRGLHLAAGNGRNLVVKFLVDKGANKEAKDRNGWRPLHTAAWNGCRGTIRMLVDLGANIEAKDSCGWTALHLAAMRGQDAAVKMLVDMPANKEAKGYRGWTALHLVAVLGLKDTTRLLVKTLTVDRKAIDWEGQTALKLAQEL